MICRRFGWRLAEGKAAFGGSGDSNLSFTHRNDVVRYVAHVLTRISPSELAGKVLRIQGEVTVCLPPFVRSSCSLTRNRLDLQQDRGWL